MPYVTVVSADGATYTDVQCETPMSTAEARAFADRLLAVADEMEEL